MVDNCCREESAQNSERWRTALVPGLVSVVTPTYNCADIIGFSIHSVMQQTYEDWELILVDDGSQDATASIAERFASHDARIRVVRLSTNNGVANARNQGIQAARGQYIAFLDSDDVWLPEKLAAQTEFLKQSGTGFCFSAYRRLEDGRISRLVRVPGRVKYKDLLGGNPIGCLTVLIDRQRIGWFTMPILKHEDFATWLTILRRGHVAWGMQQDLARYRVSGSSLSGNKLRSAGWTWQVYRKNEGLPLGTAVICFLRYLLRAAHLRFIS
jgi:glycosyltransferase involved in cell wall biosynthesis